MPVQRSPTQSHTVPTPIQIKTEPTEIQQHTQTTQNFTIDISKNTETKNMADMAEKIFHKINTYVPEFSGANSSDIPTSLTRFISLAEWVRKQISVEGHETFDQLIKYRLIDDAYRRTQSMDIRNFDDLKRTLQSQYRVTQSLDELRNTLLTCQQRHIENTEQYGQRLTNAYNNYIQGFEIKYNTKPDAASAKELMEQTMSTFKRGLRPSRLKTQIATTRVNDLNELIRESIIIEKLINENDPILQSSNQLNIQPEIPQYTFPITQTYIQPQKLCNHCSKPGHEWKQCRARLFQQMANNLQRQQTQPITNPPVQQQSTQKMYIKSCSYCQIMGHDITECRRQQNNMQYIPTPQPIPTQQFTNQTQIPPINPHLQQNFTYPQPPNTTNPNLPHNSNSQLQQQQNPQFKEKSCRYCKKIGHEINECRTKMNSDRYKQQQQTTTLENAFDNMKIYNVTQTNPLTNNTNQNYQLTNHQSTNNPYYQSTINPNYQIPNNPNNQSANNLENFECINNSENYQGSDAIY